MAALNAVRDQKLRLMFACVLIAAGASRPAGAQGTILHAIVADANTNDYVRDAAVTVAPMGLKATSDFSGDARFSGLKRGHYTVSVRKLGYAPLDTDLLVTGRDSAEITFMMRPLTHELDTVKVEESATSPVLREFEDRRRQGKGQYIVDSVLRASFPTPLENVLTSRLRGLGVTKHDDGSLEVYSSRGSNTFAFSCPISVYWNGVRITSRLINRIDVPEAFIGGIEFYNTGQAPAQYQEPGNDCGVLLLWPRP